MPSKERTFHTIGVTTPPAGPAAQAIAKRALDPAHGRRRRAGFPTARAAFEAVLRGLGVGADDRVLLPAYVGWSPREGSGVHDPVASVGARASFVRVDDRLNVDVADFERRLRQDRPKVAVLVHYFGWPDPGCADMVALCRREGVPILEDEAHALFTDLVNGTVGRLGDGAILSLHKMLPCLVGGELRVNESAPEGFASALDRGAEVEGALDPADYDLQLLAGIRAGNARLLRQELEGRIPLLWSPSTLNAIGWGFIPQSFPILVAEGRDELYERFNAAGWGGTSLYHTMIPEISSENFPESHRLARTIFNLPIHQDADPDLIPAMAADLLRMLA